MNPLAHTLSIERHDMSHDDYNAVIKEWKVSIRLIWFSHSSVDHSVAIVSHWPIEKMMVLIIHNNKYFIIVTIYVILCYMLGFYDWFWYYSLKPSRLNVEGLNILILSVKSTWRTFFTQNGVCTVALIINNVNLRFLSLQANVMYFLKPFLWCLYYKTVKLQWLQWTLLDSELKCCHTW